MKQYDLTESLEYIDKYNPNKYGLIFRERLFVNNPEVHGTFFCHLADYVDPNGQSGEKGFQSQKDAVKGKGGKGAQQPVNTGPDRDFEREPTMLKRIYLELFLEDQLIMTASG